MKSKPPGRSCVSLRRGTLTTAARVPTSCQQSLLLSRPRVLHYVSLNAQATNIRLGIRRTKDEFDIADFDGHTILEQILDDRAAVDGCAVSALEVENHVARL